jgi:hypothetical protein
MIFPERPTFDIVLAGCAVVPDAGKVLLATYYIAIPDTLEAGMLDPYAERSPAIYKVTTASLMTPPGKSFSRTNPLES